MSTGSVETKTPEYELIGELFKAYEGKPAHIIQCRTVLHLTGDVRGKSALDLACGYGFFGRELHKRGASKVIGVDISEAMIALAREESKKNGDDIDFLVGNVSEMGCLGSFDLITAIFLFNYAESLTELESMFTAVFRNLKPGGRLVAYTVEPDYKLDRGNFTPYGVNILAEKACENGHCMSAEFDTPTSSRFTFYRWPREEYERSIEKAGFSRCYWQKPLLTDADLEQYPAGFWDIYQNNCFHTALLCEY